MTTAPHYHGHRKRLRERLARNPRDLSDYEVLELLLGYVLARQDTKPLAKDLLKRCGTLRGVFTARSEELRQASGFGPALETFWAVWRECQARMKEAPVQERAVLSRPEAVAELAMARLGAASTEEFWVALVDNKNRLMAWEQVSRGTVDRTTVYSREVLALALGWSASGLILVHNHPGGDPRPSASDRELTRLLVRSAADLGLRILDHVIVAEERYFSFQAQGLLQS
ncbi:MAG: DNA repair protein RadC [Thermodesulfobacteriota bacterium]